MIPRFEISTIKRALQRNRNRDINHLPRTAIPFSVNTGLSQKREEKNGFKAVIDATVEGDVLPRIMALVYEQWEIPSHIAYQFDPWPSTPHSIDAPYTAKYRFDIRIPIMHPYKTLTTLPSNIKSNGFEEDWMVYGEEYEMESDWEVIEKVKPNKRDWDTAYFKSKPNIISLTVVIHINLYSFLN